MSIEKTISNAFFPWACDFPSFGLWLDVQNQVYMHTCGVSFKFNQNMFRQSHNNPASAVTIVIFCLVC